MKLVKFEYPGFTVHRRADADEFVITDANAAERGYPSTDWRRVMLGEKPNATRLRFRNIVVMLADDFPCDDTGVAVNDVAADVIDYVVSFDEGAFVQVHHVEPVDRYGVIADCSQLLITVEHNGERSFIVINDEPVGLLMTPAWLPRLNTVAEHAPGVKLAVGDALLMHA